jgi:hypothetical protein
VIFYRAKMSKENGVNGGNIHKVSTTSLNDGRLLTHLLQEAAAHSINDMNAGDSMDNIQWRTQKNLTGGPRT